MPFTQLHKVVQGMISAEKIKIERVEKVIQSKTSKEVKEIKRSEEKIKSWEKELNQLATLEKS